MSIQNSRMKFPLGEFEFDKLPTEAQEEIFAATSCVDKHNFCLANSDTKKFCVSNKGEGYEFSNNAYLECSSEIDEKIHDIKMNLFSAVEDGEYVLVRNLLKNKLVDVNLCTRDDVSLLMVASGVFYDPYTPDWEDTRLKRIEIVKELLKFPTIDLNYSIKHGGKTALMFAIEAGRTEIVNLLLEDRRIEPNLQDYEGHTALFYAVKSKNMEVVEALLSFDIVNLNSQGVDGKTVLMFAAKPPRSDQSPDREMVNALVNTIIERIVKRTIIYADIQDSEGQTELMAVSFAADHGNFVRTLLQADKYVVPNINLNLQDKYGMTAVMYAARYNRVEMVNALLTHGANKTPKIDVNLLSDTGFRQRSDSRASTALMLARNLDIVKLLLAYETIDVNVTDLHGNSALHRACMTDYPTLLDVEIIKTLLQVRNIDINLQNEWGETALISAINSGFDTAASVLLDYKADVNIQDKTGKTAIMLAIAAPGFSSRRRRRNNRPANLLKKLLAPQVDSPQVDSVDQSTSRPIQLRLKDKTGKTALMYATENKELDQNIRGLLESALKENKERLTELR